MRFVFNLTLREVRSSWRRLLFFFLCIAIGVGSIVALRSLIQNISRAVGGDAREFLSADIRIFSTNVFTPAALAKINETLEESGIVDGRTETIETNVMALPEGGSQDSVLFVQVKGIDENFPLVGEFQMASGEFDFEMLGDRGAVVSPILLEDLNVQIGDKIRLGANLFTIRGVYNEEPGGVGGGIGFTSRVYVDKVALENAGILKDRTNITRSLLFRTTSDPDPLAISLRDQLKGSAIRVVSYKENERRLGEQFQRIENFLSLTGLLILVLGGIGIWNVARVFVEQRRSTIAILKCLGASGQQIFLVYTLQILFLGFIGSLFGVMLAQLALWYARTQFVDVLPASMSYLVSFSNAAQGVCIGVLISLIFSVLPLMQIRDVSPRLLLHDSNNENLRSVDRTKWVVGLLLVIGLLVLSIWQAGSFKTGAIFLIGFFGVTLALYAASWILTSLLRKMKNPRYFSLSQAINSLYRPGNQTRVVLIAVGLGAFVVIAVQMLQTSLLREFELTNDRKLPSMFFVDIQRSQKPEFENIINTKTGEIPETIPTVRARLAYINGVPINFNDNTFNQDQGQIGREFAVTYRGNLESNEKIVEGAWWGNSQPKHPEVSVDLEMADKLKIETGDSISFNISGRLITAQVASLRKLDVRNSRTFFIFVFSPGTLENAPTSYVANLIKRQPSTDRLRLQRIVAENFPNVQIVDVEAIITLLQKLISNFMIAISFVGGFVILSGILILIGSIALTRSQRTYENAVLKTLGAKRARLAAIIVTEYALLGFLAGLIGAIFAVAVSWATARYILEIEWQFGLNQVLIGVAATTLLVASVGTAASIGVIFKKPLSILRTS